MRRISVLMALAITLLLMLGTTSAVTRAVPPGLGAIEARDDFAGFYKDRERGGLDTYLFVGDAAGVEAELLGHYGDASKFAIRPATYTFADLEALQDEIFARRDELAGAGIDLREVGVDVIGNQVMVGVFGSLPPAREALAEYGDKVRVVWSEGGYTGSEPDRRLTAVANRNGIRVRLTIDDNHLVAGEPIWVHTKVKNTRDRPVFDSTDGCEISVPLTGQMADQIWRTGVPVDEAAVEAEGLERVEDFKRRAANWSTVGDETIYLEFRPRDAIDHATWGCDLVGITHRIPPGGVVKQRLRWDGLAAHRLGPPPDGMDRISGSFTPGRIDGPDRKPIEVTLEVPLTGGLEPGRLHPMEAVDAAMADPAFRVIIDPVELGKRNDQVIRFDIEHDAWVVGVCGRFDGQQGYWKAALVDPESGAVTDIIDGPVGKDCRQGPWPEASVALAPDASTSIRTAVTSAPPSASLTSEPQSDVARNELFELTLSTPQSVWSVGEPIEIDTALAYIGSEPEITVFGSSSGLVRFSLDQLDGDLSPGSFMNADRQPYQFAKGDVRSIPFDKGGGYSPGTPDAPFWIAWINDYDLRPPAGSYRITAELDYEVPSRDVRGVLTTSLLIDVVDEAAASPKPSALATDDLSQSIAVR